MPEGTPNEKAPSDFAHGLRNHNTGDVKADPRLTAGINPLRDGKIAVTRAAILRLKAASDAGLARGREGSE